MKPVLQPPAHRIPQLPASPAATSSARPGEAAAPAPRAPLRRGWARGPARALPAPARRPRRWRRPAAGEGAEAPGGARQGRGSGRPGGPGCAPRALRLRFSGSAAAAAPTSRVPGGRPHARRGTSPAERGSPSVRGAAPRMPGSGAPGPAGGRWESSGSGAAESPERGRRSPHGPSGTAAPAPATAAGLPGPAGEERRPAPAPAAAPPERPGEPRGRCGGMRADAGDWGGGPHLLRTGSGRRPAALAHLPWHSCGLAGNCC